MNKNIEIIQEELKIELNDYFISMVNNLANGIYGIWMVDYMLSNKAEYKSIKPAYRIPAVLLNHEIIYGITYERMGSLKWRVELYNEKVDKGIKEVAINANPETIRKKYELEIKQKKENNRLRINNIRNGNHHLHINTTG
jgi:hypothetical protein